MMNTHWAQFLFLSEKNCWTIDGVEIMESHNFFFWPLRDPYNLSQQQKQICLPAHHLASISRYALPESVGLATHFLQRSTASVSIYACVLFANNGTWQPQRNRVFPFHMFGWWRLFDSILLFFNILLISSENPDTSASHDISLFRSTDWQISSTNLVSGVEIITLNLQYEPSFPLKL